MKVLRCFAPMFLLVALSARQTVSAGDLTIINPRFSNIPVQCSGDYALESFDGGNCTSQYPQQAFNGVLGIGWGFLYTYNSTIGSGAGLTGPNTAFNPPSFAGLPFSQAALLQNDRNEVYQVIFGFIAGQPYRLAFYLGSRYASGSGFDGDQTVEVLIDDRVIGSWSLVSYTPFALQNRLFRVATTGPHALRFVGAASGDHTAFLSGVSIETVDAADEE